MATNKGEKKRTTKFWEDVGEGNPQMLLGVERVSPSYHWELSVEFLQHTKNRTPTRYSYTAPESVPDGHYQHTTGMLGQLFKLAKYGVSPGAPQHKVTKKN